MCRNIIRQQYHFQPCKHFVFTFRDLASPSTCEIV
ncbi:hypothetical protein Omen_094 [Erwinia phage Omen]|uniref:Uncharacterized protein n=2 Tax=Caudoviricetes TaxID=2731619 RepID=A0AAU8EKK6_9CAUD